MDISDASKDVMNKFDDRIPRFLDFVPITLMVLSLLLLYYNPNNIISNQPLITFLIWIVLILAMPFMAMIISKIYVGMSGVNADMITASASLPITSFIMEYFGIVMTLYVCASYIVYMVGREQ